MAWRGGWSLLLEFEFFIKYFLRALRALRG